MKPNYSNYTYIYPSNTNHIIDVSLIFFFLDAEKMAQFAQEERNIREENLRLQRRLQLEMERRENLCRHLSESESSLEMDDERY